ncbi:hypothetical protein [Micromonospora sp. U21]|uniref:hypothetical protein n=1 Tax=Micromonospora sp. U21 TaxID=2824899 RepID=UPI001B36BD66|nr:hypothetical protein [Micromonospora sp. U21]MBQ0906055.1 hypothetical protein [Micromonospora sp. U21]
MAARYHRLMVDAGKHYDSALCHIATTLLNRIIAERCTIPEDLRAQRRTTDGGTGRRDKRSRSAPSTGPRRGS